MVLTGFWFLLAVASARQLAAATKDIGAPNPYSMRRHKTRSQASLPQGDPGGGWPQQAQQQVGESKTRFRIINFFH